MEMLHLNSLKHEISGEVIEVGDSAYEQFSQNRYYPGSPAVVVRPQSSVDVQKAVGFAREKGLRLSVRSGGHSGPAYGTNDGGMVIDLSLINTVKIIDPVEHIVRIGSGAVWGEVGRTLAEHDLALSSGDTTSVGVGGLLLGGGIGWMVRKYGLALDSLAGAEVVTAGGRIVRASVQENPDLFWAIRGGGGNFGVITYFDMAAHPLKGVNFGALMYPAAEAAPVIKGLARFMRTAPDEITSTVRMMPSFGGDPAPLMISVCYAGEDPERARQAIEPLLHLGSLTDENFKPMPYPNILEEPGEMPPGFEPTVRNGFIRTLSDELIDILAGQAAQLNTMFVELRSLGGAFARVPQDATAFAHRSSEAFVITAQLVRAPEALAGFDALWQALTPLTHGAYGNFLDKTGPEEVSRVYPTAAYARLVTVKRKFDPDNFFRHNHNIRPE